MLRVDVPADYAGDPASYVYGTMSPEIAQAALQLSTAVYQHALISLREFEGARARIAQINGCVVCQKWRSARDVPGYIEGLGGGADGSIAGRGDPEPDEAFYEQLTEWRTSSIYSEREKIAIDLAERFSLAPKSADTDEEFWANVKAHYTDAEIFDMTLSIGSWVMGGRTMHMLGLDSTCAVGGAPKKIAVPADA